MIMMMMMTARRVRGTVRTREQRRKKDWVWARNNKGNNRYEVRNQAVIRYSLYGQIGYGVKPCTKSETESSSRRVICKASIAS